MKKKIVGFFGGTFDPIHFGHLNLAIELAELHRLDEVVVCPAFCSPFKDSSPPIASPEERLMMVKLAIEEIPKFRFSSFEIDRKGPSYTIDTLRALQSEEISWRLLLSEESLAHFEQWKEVKELLSLAPPLIGSRHRTSSLQHKGETPTKIMEISSTEIRNRLRNRLYCGHLLPSRVLAYIHANHLYSGC